MSTNSVTLEAHLQAGRYNEVLADTVDSPLFVATPSAIPWVVGALSFLGRTNEAEGLFESYSSSLSAPELIKARFFYALAICRERKLKQARSLFLQSFVDMKKWLGSEDAKLSPVAESETTKFFVFQGFAFFRYSTGYFRQGFFWVQKSLKAAAGAPYSYGMGLAHELNGHVQLQLGAVRAGMKSLEISKAKAIQCGNGAVVQAFDASARLYRATYGLTDSDQIVSELNEAIYKCRYEDSYTKASLLIHLAKIMVLRGNLIEASDLLDQASPLVYQVDNPYLETTYNLALAKVQMDRGHHAVALSIAKTASQRATERTHMPSVIKALGLQAALLEKLGLHREQSAIQASVRSLTQKTGGYIARRILNRLDSLGDTFRIGEDPLGDLMDDVLSKKPGAMSQILSYGWYGLLRSYLDIRPDQKVIYFDLAPNSMTIFDFGHVEHRAEGCSHLIKKLLLSLALDKDLGKEKLTIKLWGQEYSPLRHDNLIYGLIARSRKLLGRYAHWIEVSEIGYRLNDAVKIKNGMTVGAQQGKYPAMMTFSDGSEADLEMATNGVPERSRECSKKQDILLSRLNVRQIEIVNWLGEGKRLLPKELVNRLKVSDATATRDLAGLVDLGMIRRCGSGRATFYVAAAGDSN